jgi:hypothetical protein
MHGSVHMLAMKQTTNGAQSGAVAFSVVSQLGVSLAYAVRLVTACAIDAAIRSNVVTVL